MNTLACSLNFDLSSNEELPGAVRKVITRQGNTQREVLSKDICCVCEKYIWVVSETTSKATIMQEAFSVGDSRAYIDGIPDYLSVNGKRLIHCHYKCQQTLIEKFDNGTFAKR